MRLILYLMISIMICNTSFAGQSRDGSKYEDHSKFSWPVGTLFCVTFNEGIKMVSANVGRVKNWGAGGGYGCSTNVTMGPGRAGSGAGYFNGVAKPNHSVVSFPVPTKDTYGVTSFVMHVVAVFKANGDTGVGQIIIDSGEAAPHAIGNGGVYMPNDIGNINYPFSVFGNGNGSTTTGRRITRGKGQPDRTWKCFNTAVYLTPLTNSSVLFFDYTNGVDSVVGGLKGKLKIGNDPLWLGQTPSLNSGYNTCTLKGWLDWIMYGDARLSRDEQNWIVTKTMVGGN